MGRWFAAVMLFCVLRILRLTWRVKVVGSPADGARLVAFWHGDQLLLSALKARRMAVLVSRSRDGTLAARLAGWLGFSVVRGSTSRGAVESAIEMVRRLRAGKQVALAVDGPRGPRHRVNGAPHRVAMAGRCEIAPVAAAARRTFTLSSWDRLCIPAPFTSVVIVWGRRVAAGVSPVQQELDDIAHRASALVGRACQP